MTCPQLTPTFEIEASTKAKQDNVTMKQSEEGRLWVELDSMLAM